MTALLLLGSFGCQSLDSGGTTAPPDCRVGLRYRVKDVRGESSEEFVLPVSDMQNGLRLRIDPARKAVVPPTGFFEISCVIENVGDRVLHVPRDLQPILMVAEEPCDAMVGPVTYGFEPDSARRSEARPLGPGERIVYTLLTNPGHGGSDMQGMRTEHRGERTMYWSFEKLPQLRGSFQFWCLMGLDGPTDDERVWIGRINSEAVPVEFQ